MAETLWEKDGAILEYDGGLAGSEDCCCDDVLGAFFEAGPNQYNALSITGTAPLTLSEFTVAAGWGLVPPTISLERGMIYFTNNDYTKYLVIGLSVSKAQSLAKYYNGAVWSDVSTGLFAGPPGTNLSHRSRGTTLKSLSILNALYEKGQSGFPACVYTNVTNSVFGTDVGDTTYFAVWNGTSWGLTTHQFTAYSGKTEYHVDQVADYYKPNRWAMGILFDSTFNYPHHVFNGALVKPHGFLGTNQWWPPLYACVALDDTYLYCVIRNASAGKTFMYRYHTTTQVWTVRDDVNDVSISMRGITVHSNGKWYGIGGNLTYQSYFYKDSFLAPVILPGTSPARSESIYVHGKYIIIPGGGSGNNYLYDTTTDTLHSYASTPGFSINPGQGTVF